MDHLREDSGALVSPHSSIALFKHRTDPRPIACEDAVNFAKFQFVCWEFLVTVIGARDLALIRLQKH
jgi:hypothetical protein